MKRRKKKKKRRRKNKYFTWHNSPLLIEKGYNSALFLFIHANQYRDNLIPKHHDTENSDFEIKTS